MSFETKTRLASLCVLAGIVFLMAFISIPAGIGAALICFGLLSLMKLLAEAVIERYEAH